MTNTQKIRFFFKLNILEQAAGNARLKIQQKKHFIQQLLRIEHFTFRFVTFDQKNNNITVIFANENWRSGTKHPTNFEYSVNLRTSSHSFC